MATKTSQITPNLDVQYIPGKILYHRKNLISKKIFILPDIPGKMLYPKNFTSPDIPVNLVSLDIPRKFS